MLKTMCTSISIYSDIMLIIHIIYSIMIYDTLELYFDSRSPAAML